MHRRVLWVPAPLKWAVAKERTTLTPATEKFVPCLSVLQFIILDLRTVTCKEGLVPRRRNVASKFAKFVLITVILILRLFLRDGLVAHLLPLS